MNVCGSTNEDDVWTVCVCVCVCADVCGEAPDKLLASTSCELDEQQEQEPDYSKQCHHGNTTGPTTPNRNQKEDVQLATAGSITSLATL